MLEEVEQAKREAELRLADLEKTMVGNCLLAKCRNDACATYSSFYSVLFCHLLNSYTLVNTEGTEISTTARPIALASSVGCSTSVNVDICIGVFLYWFFPVLMSRTSVNFLYLSWFFFQF